MNLQKAAQDLSAKQNYLISEEEVKNALWVARKVIEAAWNELPFWKRIWMGIKALLGVIDDYLYDTEVDPDE